MSAQRATKQRSAIERIFSRIPRPLSPTEIHEEAQEEVPRLGIATVYRALNDMVEEGVLRSVDLPGQPSRYEKADLDHHHHFHCQGCDRVFDLEGCLLKKDIHLPGGFILKSHDITLNGLCPECAAKR